MDSQVYLLLVRQSGSYKDFVDKLKNATAMTVVVLIKQILKDMITGDSLDAPFVKFIRLNGVSHQMSFKGGREFSRSGSARSDDWEESYTAGSFAPNPMERKTLVQKAKRSNTFKGTLLKDWGGGNTFVQSKLPEHGAISFTKNIDTATAQLAYGCAAQEKFPLAIFFYRRKAGLGIGGIRLPYFVMACFKSKIENWKIDGDQESADLHYKTISWCSYDQWADTNVSYPWSTRWFNQETFKGGQGGVALGLQVLVAGLVLAAGAVAGAATGGGADDGSDSDLDGP